NIRALNGRFNTSITHAYSIVIGSKHITLNATGGGFLTASKQFRHGATSKSRSNTASNSTKHKSPHLSGWRQIISLKIGRAVQQECRDRTRMPSSASKNITTNSIKRHSSPSITI